MEMLRLLGCTVDLSTGSIDGGAGGDLTERELDLLRYLAERPDLDVSRETLLVDVFGYAAHVASRAVDKTLFTLRKKVERDSAAPDHILTVRGVGYRFVPMSDPRKDLLLPPAPDRFVGRAPELARLQDLLAAPGLATLTGPGGVGKTRLATEAARRHGAAHLAELQEARTDDDVSGRIAHALGVSVARIGPALASHGDAVLVLDAAEGCIEPLARVLADLATTLLEHHGDAPAARAAAQESLALARDPLRRGLALRRLATQAQDVGDWEEARSLGQRAIEQLDAAGASHSAAIARFYLGITCYWTGDTDTALRLYRQVEQELVRHGALSELGAVRANIGNVLLARGRKAEAVDWYRRAIAETRAAGDRAGSCQWLFNFGGLLLELGELGAAREALEDARDLSSHVYATVRAHGEIQWGRLLLAEGRASEAVEVLYGAREALVAAGDRVFQVASGCALSAALRAADRADEADAALQEADELARAIGFRETPLVREMFDEIRG